jgi:hypothetical protein
VQYADPPPLDARLTPECVFRRDNLARRARFVVST